MSGDAHAPDPPSTPLVRQAGCVAIGGRGVLIEGPPGSGKSSLALALIDRGASLVGDDGVTLHAEGPVLVASPPPNTRGLIEIRNVGIVSLPCLDRVPVALLLRLDSLAPRFVEAPGQTLIAGVSVPSLRLYPESPTLALRAEWALRLHGLPA